MEMVRMVAFRAHMRGDGMVKRGDEFEVSEAESHAYLARRNPLAGPLDMDEVKVAAVTVKKAPAPAKAPAKARPRKKAK